MKGDQTKKSKYSLVLLLAPLVFSFAIAQDIFVPELPKLLNILHTNQFMIQLSLSLFMIAVGAGQLLVGPLSDHFGRRKVVLLSIILYTLGSIMAGTIDTIGLLIVARIIQGIGACGMMVCSFAIVRDLFEGNESAELYSYLNGAIAVSPLLAPLAGGYLDVFFGWRAPFLTLATIGVLIFIVIFIFLKESQSPSHKIKFDKMIFSRYKKILKNKVFLSYSLIVAFVMSVFFTFFSISSYLLIDTMKVPETHFGYYFAIIGIIFFIGNIVAAKLVAKLGIYKLTLIGAIGFLLSGIALIIWTMLSGSNLLDFMIPTCVSGFFGALMLGAATAGALELYGDMSGAAAAIVGAAQFLLPSIVASIILIWPATTNYSYAIPLMICAALALLALWAVHKFNKLESSVRKC